MKSRTIRTGLLRVIAATIVLSGCATLSPKEAEPMGERQEIALYYATNRQHRNVSDPDKFFADGPASPASRIFYGRYPASTDRHGEDFLPGNLRILETNVWFDEVRSLAVVNGKPQRLLLVYVHGYNNGFSDAAKATARLYSGFGDSVVPIFFSWPSVNRIASYMSDEREAERSAQYFGEFLQELSLRIPEAKIAVVAHSMGSRVLVRGLQQWRIAQPNLWDKNRPPVLSAAALFAADIDKDTYAGSYSPTVNGGARSILIYASAKDRALAVSRGFHGSEPRLGQTDPSPYRDDRAETIDATDAGHDFLGHGYFAGNRAVITDLAYAISDGIPARGRRGLKAVPSILAPKYWWLLVK
jgi:esterase/lipase superfamily enzyme